MDIALEKNWSFSARIKSIFTGLISSKLIILKGLDYIVTNIHDITSRKQAEQQLKESEQRFKILHNASFGGIAVHDKGLILECNQGLSDITGYSINELVGMDGLLLIAPDYRAFVMNKITSGYEEVYEAYGIRKNQEIYPITLEAKNMPYNGKQVRAVEFRDITERKQTEEALQRSEKRFRVAQEMSPDGFTILHPVRNQTGEIIDFTWVYENKAAARTNQTDPQKVIGKRLLDLFPAHSRTSIFEAYKHVANTGETQKFEEINVGEIISRPTWMRLVVVSMGEDIAILSQDITDRKLAEEISEVNAYKFKSLFDEMSTGAAIYKVLNDGKYGKDYIIQDFNKAALKAEGKEKAEVLGRSLYDLRPNIDQYGLIPVFQSVWKTGEPADYPIKLYVDEKFSNWYENRIYKLPSGEIVAIFEDLTEKRQAEESLHEIERKH
ncbi:MAG: PAS domain S-box protein [Actinomycetota bacterium]|nr:PAS domain S-box protein [Actinomycetota bacterium]